MRAGTAQTDITGRASAERAEIEEREEITWHESLENPRAMIGHATLQACDLPQKR